MHEPATCLRCKQTFTPCALCQPVCTACGAVDAHGRRVLLNDQVRIARWHAASEDSGAELRTGTVYQINQQHDGRWVLMVQYPPAPYKRSHGGAFSYDMVLAPAQKPGSQLTLF